MVAARLLGVEFSMTLHGSDLLLHATYLDVKLGSCAFCLTVSEYNRRYILEALSQDGCGESGSGAAGSGSVRAHRHAQFRDRDQAVLAFTLLAVGRLHAVKDHAFLVRACAQLRAAAV